MQLGLRGSFQVLRPRRYIPRRDCHLGRNARKMVEYEDDMVESGLFDGVESEDVVVVRCMHFLVEDRILDQTLHPRSSSLIHFRCSVGMEEAKEIVVLREEASVFVGSPVASHHPLPRTAMNMEPSLLVKKYELWVVLEEGCELFGMDLAGHHQERYEISHRREDPGDIESVLVRW